MSGVGVADPDAPPTGAERPEEGADPTAGQTAEDVADPLTTEIEALISSSSELLQADAEHTETRSAEPSANREEHVIVPSTASLLGGGGGGGGGGGAAIPESDPGAAEHGLTTGGSPADQTDKSEAEKALPPRLPEPPTSAVDKITEAGKPVGESAKPPPQSESEPVTKSPQQSQAQSEEKLTDSPVRQSQEPATKESPVEQSPKPATKESPIEQSLEPATEKNSVEQSVEPAIKEIQDQPSLEPVPKESPIEQSLEPAVRDSPDTTISAPDSQQSHPDESMEEVLSDDQAAQSQERPPIKEVKPTDVTRVKDANEDEAGLNDSGLGDDRLSINNGSDDATTTTYDTMETEVKESVPSVTAMTNDSTKSDDSKPSKPAAAAPEAKVDPKTPPAVPAARPDAARSTATPADSTGEGEESVEVEEGESWQLADSLMTAVRRSLSGLLCMCRWLCSKLYASIKSLGGALPLTFNFAIFSLLVWLMAEYVVNPVQGSSIDFISRMRYVLRATAWPALLPVLASVVSRWKKTEIHRRVADESFRHLMLQSINLVILATHAHAECFHYIWVLCVVTAAYGFLYWFSLVFGKGVGRAALSQPLMVTACALSVYNLYTIVMQDLGYGDMDIWMTRPQPELSGGYWKYATMCHMVERVFCSVDGQSHYVW